MRSPVCAVFATTPRQRELAARTLRALAALGLSPIDLTGAPGVSRGPDAPSRTFGVPSRAERTSEAASGFSRGEPPLEEVIERLGAAPLWLVRAGAWPRLPASGTLPWPSPSATGLPLCALGAVLSPGASSLGRAPAASPGASSSASSSSSSSSASESSESSEWSQWFRACGGDSAGSRRGASRFLEWSRRRKPTEWTSPMRGASWEGATGGALRLPRVASVYLDAELGAAVARRLVRGDALQTALEAELAMRPARVVRHAPLDVFDDAALRVAQVVTSVQQGGAERVAVDLAGELPRLGVRSRVYALYRSSRPSLDVPVDTVEITALLERAPQASPRAAPLEMLARELAAWGSDVVHAHLLDARELEFLASRGHRALVTVHNLARSWPAGLATLDARAVAVFVACAHAVEAEVSAHVPAIPCRTLWNGIRLGASAGSPWRRTLGVPDGAWLLAAVANYRPQKRLERLPAILAATDAELDARGDAREVHLVIAGSASGPDGAAEGSRRALEDAIAATGVRGRVHLAGSVADVTSLLAAADVLVSPSAFEGLSLAQLEALAAGVPVVASGEGGTAELAALTPDMVHLPLAASPQEYARAILDVGGRRAQHGHQLVRSRFALEGMARAYARLYPRALARQRPRRRGEGLWLITNNFSTGGAQSSARRLLLGLTSRGLRCRAAVLQEDPEHPTLGRRALVEAGIPVLAVAPPDELEPAAAVAQLLAAIEDDVPEAIVLWNVIPEHKLLLAEGALDVPLFDVSPGEMYFASLDRQFRTPHPGLPYRSARDYGARLAGVIVKYAAEVATVRSVLGVAAHVVPNGVELGPPPRERVGQAPAGSRSPRLVIGTAVRIHPHKKLDQLLAALRLAAPELPPYVLRIAGGVEEGAEEHALELRGLAQGLDVEWRGELADTRAFLEDLDLFVLVAEPAGCPNASLEAMALGLPVVATAVGGMSEQIDSPRTGSLVPAGDVSALARALVELARDPERRARVGRAAWERMRDGFSLSRMLEGYARVCLGRSLSPQAETAIRPEASHAAGGDARVGEVALSSLASGAAHEAAPRSGAMSGSAFCIAR